MDGWIEVLREMLEDVPLKAIAEAAAGMLITFVVGLVLTWVALFGFRRVRRWALSTHAVADDTSGEYGKRVSTIIGLSRTMVMTVLWIVVVVILLSEAGLDITPILAGAGIVGLAVGFGAQNLVRDVISGAFHILENQVRVGDVVRINNLAGIVEQVSYRIIVLRDLDWAVHIIPHGKVDTITNFTKGIAGMMMDVGVAYKENTDHVVGVLREVATGMKTDPHWSPRILGDLEIIGVNEFADSAVNIRVRMLTVPIEKWAVGREFRRRVKLEFDRRGIEIPFPHRTLYLAPGSAPMRIDRGDGAEGEEAPEEEAEQLARLRREQQAIQD